MKNLTPLSLGFSMVGLLIGCGGVVAGSLPEPIPAVDAHVETAQREVGPLSDEDGLPTAEAFGFVIDAGGTRYFVINTNADVTLREGAMALLERGAPYIAVSPVAQERTADLRRVWEGRSIEAFTASNAACVLTAGELRLMRRFEPNFEEMAMWDGEDGHPRMSDDEVAREMFEYGEDAVSPSTYLVATLDDGVCTGKPVWGRGLRADREQPTFFASSTAQAATLRAREVFHHTAEYIGIANGVETGRNMTWDQIDDANGAAIATTTTPVEGHTYNFAFAAAGGPCADYVGELATFIDLSADPNARARTATIPIESAGVEFQAFVDVDADGMPELLLHDVLYKIDFANNTAHSVSITRAFFGCGC